MSILILGNKGMLGHMLELYLMSKDYNVIGINRNHVDFRNTFKLLDLIKNFSPDIIINAAGILKNGKDLSEFADINIVLPRILSKLDDFKLIHFSTNCVFDDIGPHDEHDIPNSRDIYGLSKAFGEVPNEKHLTIRTSIIGPEIRNKQGYSGLMDQFIRNSNFTKGYVNIMWNGVTTLELSKFVEKNMGDLTGLINFYTKKEISKYEIISLINRIFNINRKIEPIVNNNAHSSLLKGKFFTNKSYYEQLMELKQWMFKYKHIYEKSYPTLFY